MHTYGQLQREYQTALEAERLLRSHITDHDLVGLDDLLIDARKYVAEVRRLRDIAWLDEQPCTDGSQLGDT